jgi:hypothetical protein
MLNYFSSSPIITNTIIWDNGSSEVANNSSSTTTFKNSIIKSSGGSASWNIAYAINLGANLDADPLFVDAANGDYSLMPGSPAIDAGDGSANATALDLAGNPRIDGVIDMGAYEFQNTVNVDFTAADICADATEWLVPIEVGTVSSPIGAISLVLDYDNTKMTFDAVSSNNLNATIGATGNLQVNDVNGKLYISWQDNNGQSVSNQSLMTLRFIPINSAADFSAFAGTTTDFTWDESVVGNCELADIAGNVLSTNFSAQIGAAINELPTPTFFNDASISNTICAGETIIFTAGGGDEYEFFVNGTSVQAQSTTATFPTATLANNDIVKVVVTNTTTTCTASTEETITVQPLPTPTLGSTATNDEICVGDKVTFTATGGTSYEFFVDAASQGTASARATFSTSTLTDGQEVTVKVTNGNGCSAISTGITTTVNPLPIVTFSALPTSICPGENVIFTAGGGDEYEFFVDGIQAQAQSATATFSTTALTDQQVVTVKVTNTTTTCFVTSAGITITVNPLPTPILGSTATNDEICAGDNVTFTGTDFTGTDGNEYEFFVNGTPVQAQSATATFSTTTLVNNDVVTVKVTNTATGCSATSTGVTITVNALPIPTLGSDDSDNRVCSGNTVTFNATGANEYIFLIDGVIAQAQSATATYAHTATTDGEVISVIGVNTTTGCQGTSTTTFTLDVDVCYDYSGALVYDNAVETPMGNVNITLTGANDIQIITTDVTDGTFTLTDLFNQETYTATYATTKTHGGINSTDALIIFLRSLSLFTYSNNVALKDTASDVNGSGDILTVDALQVQLRFVTTISTFAAEDWAFGTNTLSVNGINATAQKIYALAMGDVNGSYTPDIAENAKVTLQNNGSLMVNDGDRIMIPVRMEQREVLGAISMVMNISPTMTVHNVVLADNSAVQYHINGNELKIGWYSSNPLDLATGDVLFYIDATISDAAQFIANPITLSNESELADDIAAAIDNAVVSIPTMNTLSTNLTTINGEQIGVRNFPNPFRATTMIEYTLPTAAEVSIITYNSLGQPVNQIVNANHVAGIHQVTWDASALPSGMYFYTITINDGEAIYTATKSVLLSK